MSAVTPAPAQLVDAIDINGNKFQIPVKFEEILIERVKNDPESFSSFDVVTKKVAELACVLYPENLSVVHENLLEKHFVSGVLSRNGRALQHLKKKFDDNTYSIFVTLAIKSFPPTIIFVSSKFLREDHCIIAVEFDTNLLYYIPENLQTEKVLEIVRHIEKKNEPAPAQAHVEPAPAPAPAQAQAQILAREMLNNERSVNLNITYNVNNYYNSPVPPAPVELVYHAPAHVQQLVFMTTQPAPRAEFVYAAAPVQVMYLNAQPAPQFTQLASNVVFVQNNTHLNAQAAVPANFGHMAYVQGRPVPQTVHTEVVGLHAQPAQNFSHVNVDQRQVVNVGQGGFGGNPGNVNVNQRQVVNVGQGNGTMLANKS